VGKGGNESSCIDREREGDTILTLLPFSFVFSFFLSFYTDLFFLFVPVPFWCVFHDWCGCAERFDSSFLLVCMNYHPYYLLLLLLLLLHIFWAAFFFCLALMFGGVADGCGFYFFLPIIVRSWINGVCIGR
jgi:hypothetical protein